MSFRRLFFGGLLLSFYGVSLGVSFSQAQSVANFVSMPPCRVMDTRDPKYGASFGPPSLPAQTSRDFPIPSSTCGIPAGALAYSFNVTAVPHGSLPWLKMWPTGQAQPEVSTLNSYDGKVVANAAIVPAGTNGSVSVYVEGNADVIVDINGYFVAPSTATTDTLNQQVGQVNQQVTQLSQQISQVNQLVPIVGQHTTQIGQLNQQVTQLGQQITSATGVSSSSKGIQSTALGVGASSNAAQNTAVGFNSLYSNDSGSSNTAMGANALGANVSGGENVGVGAGALANNTSGASNTAVGTQALSSNGITSNNTAVGTQALWSHNGGCCNTAVGFQAMFADTGGQNNVAIGDGALSANLIGGSNIAIGFNAGNAVTGYNNIDIGNSGTSTDSNTIRIGTAGQQMSVYIAGITGVWVGSSSPVYVNANGQLGTIQSSRRYKEDIQDMGAASDAVMQLRPVQFRYKQAAPDGSKPLQFGLIAEEVAQVYPELVVRDKEGQIESVQYQQLPAMLLNELQKQHQIIERQEQEIQALESHLAALERAGAKSK